MLYGVCTESEACKSHLGNARYIIYPTQSSSYYPYIAQTPTTIPALPLESHHLKSGRHSCMSYDLVAILKICIDVNIIGSFTPTFIVVVPI